MSAQQASAQERYCTLPPRHLQPQTSLPQASKLLCKSPSFPSPFSLPSPFVLVICCDREAWHSRNRASAHPSLSCTTKNESGAIQQVLGSCCCSRDVQELLCLAKQAASPTQQDVTMYPIWQAALARSVTKLETEFGHPGSETPAVSSSQAPRGNHLLVKPNH